MLSKEVCVVVAQIVPLILIPTIYLNTQMASKAWRGDPVWIRLMNIFTFALGLATIPVALFGVNNDGLSSVGAAVIVGGMLALLLGILMNVIYGVFPELTDHRSNERSTVSKKPDDSTDN